MAGSRNDYRRRVAPAAGARAFRDRSVAGGRTLGSGWKYAAGRGENPGAGRALRSHAGAGASRNSAVLPAGLRHGLPVGQSNRRASGRAGRDILVHHHSAGAGARGARDHGHGGDGVHRGGRLRGPALGGTAGPAAHGRVGRRGGAGDDRQILPAGVPAGDLCGDVSVSLARHARHTRTTAGILAAGGGGGRHRVPGDLGRLSLLVRADDVCPCVRARAAILRRAEGCLGSQQERARVLHSWRAAPFRRVVFLPGDLGGEDTIGAAACWLAGRCGRRGASG